MKTFQLAADVFTLTPAEGTCAVKSISEEHPTGRSMIYTVAADCGGGSGGDTFTLDFGASDTVMQMKRNDLEPVRLVRCPALAQP